MSKAPVSVEIKPCISVFCFRIVQISSRARGTEQSGIGLRKETKPPRLHATEPTDSTAVLSKNSEQNSNAHWAWLNNPCCVIISLIPLFFHFFEELGFYCWIGYHYYSKLYRDSSNSFVIAGPPQNRIYCASWTDPFFPVSLYVIIPGLCCFDSGFNTPVSSSPFPLHQIHLFTWLFNQLLEQSLVPDYDNPINLSPCDSLSLLKTYRACHCMVLDRWPVFSALTTLSDTLDYISILDPLALT